jgi:PAS domain S-box-containing protein
MPGPLSSVATSREHRLAFLAAGLANLLAVVAVVLTRGPQAAPWLLGMSVASGVWFAIALAMGRLRERWATLGLCVLISIVSICYAAVCSFRVNAQEGFAFIWALPFIYALMVPDEPVAILSSSLVLCAAGTIFQYRLGVDAEHANSWMALTAVAASFSAFASWLFRRLRRTQLTSERTRSEELAARRDELARSETSFRALVEASPDAIVVSRSGRIVFVNGAAVGLLRCGTAGDLAGAELASLFHPDDRGAIASTSPGRPVGPPRVLRMLRRDGHALTVELTTVPVEWDGEPATLALGRDVSERREMEHRLAVADRLASMGTLAAGVAHEINNPVSYVLANASFVAEELSALSEGNPALADLVSAAKDACTGAERVRDIVRDLKLFAHGSRGDSVHPVDLGKALRLAANMSRSAATNKGRFVVEIGELPRVSSSESRLGQVFVNLLVNAWQSIPEGAPEANEVLLRAFTEGGRAVVEVRDTGTGMTPEVRSRLFEPFFTTKPAGVGTGLGLSVCHQIVSQMGGEIGVESAPGKGTCFRVTLPAAQVPALTPAPGAAAPA